MKNEIIIPVLKVEDVEAATKRRDTYALTRDQQAAEFNEAITARLLVEAKKTIKCEKCGKEFESIKNMVACPDCR